MSAQKVAAYNRWSPTYKRFQLLIVISPSDNILVFWKVVANEGGRLQEVVAQGGLTVCWPERNQSEMFSLSANP